MEKITIINSTATETYNFNDGSSITQNVWEVEKFDKTHNYFTMTPEQQLVVDIQEVGKVQDTSSFIDIISPENMEYIHSILDYITTFLGLS